MIERVSMSQKCFSAEQNNRFLQGGGVKFSWGKALGQLSFDPDEKQADQWLAARVPRQGSWSGKAELSC